MLERGSVEVLVLSIVVGERGGEAASCVPRHGGRAACPHGWVSAVGKRCPCAVVVWCVGRDACPPWWVSMAGKGALCVACCAEGSGTEQCSATLGTVDGRTAGALPYPPQLVSATVKGRSCIILKDPLIDHFEGILKGILTCRWGA